VTLITVKTFTLEFFFQIFDEDVIIRSVSYTGNRYPIPGDRAPGDRAPDVTMIG